MAAVASGSAMLGLVAALKSWSPCPVRLKVTMLDGATSLVAVASARNKWSRIQQTLTPLEWARVEGLNAREELVGVYDHPDLEAIRGGAATDLEDLETDRSTASVHALVSLMERASDRAVQRLGDHHVRVLDASLRVLDAMAARLLQSEAQSAQHAQTIQALLQQTASDGDGGDGAVLEIAQLATRLLSSPASTPITAAAAAKKGK